VRERFGTNCELERHSRRQDQVERAILVIDRKQAVEGEQAREQRAQPEDRGSHAREQGEIRADGERHERHHDEKE
jgi:hypothetical protein